MARTGGVAVVLLVLLLLAAGCGGPIQRAQPARPRGRVFHREVAQPKAA
jgi:hypothetical protein